MCLEIESQNDAGNDLKNMNLKKALEKHIRGWLPKETILVYARKASKPRWRRPFWITLTVVVAVALAGTVFIGVSTYLRYSNPPADITACYYEKTVNGTTVKVGDVVEVNVFVYWHGYVIPEFKRNVKIVDPFPESYFTLTRESNVYESKGYGGSYQFEYLLSVVEGEGVSVELPEPRLYLDNVEVSIEGTSPLLKLRNSVELEVGT